jgi:hypothetical protein
MARLVAAAVVASLLVAAPVADASKRSEARRYAAALRDYAKGERDAAAASAAAYRARSDAVAAGCLDVVREGAREQFVAVVMLSTFWVVKPAAEAAQPHADRLVRRLARTPTRSRALRRARRAHARRNRDVARIPALVPADLCAVLREWQAAGWRTADRPASLAGGDAIESRIHERDDAAVARGARFLRRHGAGAGIADVFNRGAADGFQSLYAGDPVLQAIEDAVNS